MSKCKVKHLLKQAQTHSKDNGYKFSKDCPFQKTVQSYREQSTKIDTLQCIQAQTVTANLSHFSLIYTHGGGMVV